MNTYTGNIDRGLAVRYGEEAVRICERGSYVSASGTAVTIEALRQAAVANTVTYSPGADLPPLTRHAAPTTVEITNETTLSAAGRLLDAGANPVVLNFASATTPGGGFLNGGRAQEEYLARSSCLFACLRDNAMYDYHRRNWSPFYSDYAIYSPGVPVFRADNGELLASPYPLAMITCAAVRANKVPEDQRDCISPTMAARINRVLAIGLARGHDAIVLGAWGCGAFGNDGHEIARLFRDALTGEFADAYRQVIFAIVDWSAEQRFIGPFQAILEADDDHHQTHDHR